VAARIVEDLSKIRVQDEAGGTKDIPGPYVEPVQLQLVCDDLWQKLPGDVEEITLEHWEKLGSVDQALGQFYEKALRDCIANTGVDEAQLRGWFESQLITPGRTRGMAFKQGSDVAGLRLAVVEYLEERYVVRAENRSGGRWYELTHDRLVAPILNSNAPFKARRAEREAAELKAAEEKRRRAVQKRERARRVKFFGFLGGGILIVVAVVAAFLIQKAAERHRQAVLENERTVGRFEALKNLPEAERDLQAASIFDSVASYLSIQNNREKLIRLLKANQSLLPATYGLEPTGAADARVDPTIDWPLRIEYSSDENDLDWSRLQSYWPKVVEALRIADGIVLPGKLRFDRRYELPPGSFRISTWKRMACSGESTSHASTAQGASPSWVFNLPRTAGLTLLSARSVHETLRATFESLPPLETPLSSFGGPWYYVPNWTLPLWRVAGGNGTSREAGIMLAVGEALHAHPELALSCDAVKAMVGSVHKAHPSIVNEAMAMRGGLEGLRNDLIEVRGAGSSLVGLEYLLDALADHGSEPSRVAAKKVAEEIRLPARRPVRLSGARALQSSGIDVAHAFDGVHVALTEVAPISVAPSLRLYVGANVAERVKGEDGSLAGPLAKRMTELRRAAFTSRGLTIPGMSVRAAATYGEALGPDEVRLEILNQTSLLSGAKGVNVGATPDEMIVHLVRESVKATAAWWIDADSTRRDLAEVPQPLVQWLLRRYTTTDLKNIQRAVLNDLTVDSQQSGATLARLSWLLGSLAFWEQIVPDRNDAADVAERLRTTQKARLRGSASGGFPDGPATADVAKGIAALRKLRLEDATLAFRSAVRRDAESAKASFLALYPELAAPAERSKELLAECPLPSPAAIGTIALAPLTQDPTQLEFEVADFLEHDAATLSNEDRRHLELWQLLASTLGSQGIESDVDAQIKKLVGDEKRGGWSPEQRYWLAYGALHAWRAEVAAPPLLPEIRKTLSGALATLGRHDARVAAWRVTSIAGPSRPRPWFVDMVAELGKDQIAQPDIAIDLAQFVGMTRNDRTFSQMSSILDAMRGSQVPEVKRMVAHPFYDLTRAIAIVADAEYGKRSPTEAAQQIAEEADQIYRLTAPIAAKEPAGMSPMQASGVREQAFQLASISFVFKHEYERAEAELDAGIRALQAGTSLSHQLVFVRLARGNIESARAAIADLGPLQGQSQDVRYMKAVIDLLAMPKGYDEAARLFIQGPAHEYQDYTRLLYWWRLSEQRHEEGDRMLRERLSKCDRANWRKRLLHGQIEAWREMLIGYYLGEVPDSDLFDPLANDEAFAKSELKTVGSSRTALRAEGYFYRALKQQASGPPETRQARYIESLRLAQEITFPIFYEYHMARFLLRQAEQAEKR
ncbi:MAG: hypothetical protein ABW133_15555, partial [Polyangiaceae bacterium]